MPALGYLLALLIGVSLGLLGAGGSILAVPVFHYVLGFEVKPAIAMSLAVVGTTSAIGALQRLRLGEVDGRAVAAFVPAAMVGAFLGARGALLVPAAAQMTLFAVTMVAAATFMWRGRPEHDAATARPHPVLVALAGLGVGLLSGMVGVGGGFLIVPALVLLLDVHIKQAVGTSLAIIAFNAFTGFASYLGKVPLDISVMAVFTGFAVAGLLIGARLGRRVSGAGLRRQFAVFLLLVGAFILYRTLTTSG